MFFPSIKLRNFLDLFLHYKNTMVVNENQVQEHEPIEDLDTDSNKDQDNESVEDAEQTPTNKTFRIGCMTFCLAVTVLFLWVGHHQTQFHDNYRKASFLMSNDEPEKAIEAYQKAIKNKNRTLFLKKVPFFRRLSFFREVPSYAYNNLGDAYMHAEQFPQAIETFKKVIQMAPDMAVGYSNLSTAYLMQNEPTNTREICLHALQTFPKVARLHYNLACAYALTDEHQKALDSLKQAVELDSDLRNFAEQVEALKHILPMLP